MLLAQPDQVFFPDHRLSSCVDIHIDSQFFSLTYDIVDLIIGKVQFVAVFRSPAAGAVKVAGAGGIQQDGPGNIAAVFLSALFLFGPSD